MQRQIYILLPHPHMARQRAIAAVGTAPDGWVVELHEPKRSDELSAKYHAICSDLAKSQMQWAGKRRTKDQWKILLLSGHAVATKLGADLVPGLENEFVNLRESSATMSARRMSSLVEYALAWCAEHNVMLSA